MSNAFALCRAPCGGVTPRSGTGLPCLYTRPVAYHYSVDTREISRSGPRHDKNA